MLGRRKKQNPSDRAAEIIEKHRARSQRSSELFTPSQEALRRQLGLHPDSAPQTREAEREKIKDPLTKRQRILMRELGLSKEQD